MKKLLLLLMLSPLFAFSESQIDSAGTTQQAVQYPVLVKQYDLLGQEIPDSYRGFVILLYSDGKTYKFYRA